MIFDDEMTALMKTATMKGLDASPGIKEESEIELTPEELLDEYKGKVEKLLDSYPEGADPRAIKRYEELPILSGFWISTKYMKWLEA